MYIHVYVFLHIYIYTRVYVFTRHHVHTRTKKSLVCLQVDMYIPHIYIDTNAYMYIDIDIVHSQI